MANVCKKITVTGIVQGVGFRPFIFRLANSAGLSGWVKNVSGRVEILLKGKALAISEFITRLEACDEPFIEIDDIVIEEIDENEINEFLELSETTGFTIRESGLKADFEFPKSSPDVCLCENCKAEILDSENRRFNHYFNSCVNCGPRFSVLEAFPYDRINTSMKKFPLCPKCSEEYETPLNRRFHAQTICCNECGPRLIYKDKNNNYNDNEAFNRALTDLKNGEVVAIKGIGGYHFACDPFNGVAVKRLRELKNRDNKPFAVMFRDIKAIKKICEVSKAEEETLLSPARPIALLRLLENPFPEAVLRGSAKCGCFLPYTALHELMLQEIDCLILTSANVSNSPIIIKDEDALKFEKVLCHEREIIRPLEDSVVQVINDEPQILRSGRGFAPFSIKLNNNNDFEILALGGDLKASFALAKGDDCITSSYFGDLENAEVFERYKSSVRDYLKLFGISPRKIVCDKHPRYFSAEFARELASEFNAELIAVQHHRAHIASVIAEHNLSGKVLGIAFDGTGFGDDNNVWGSEFLLCDGATYKRIAALKPVKLLGGDESARDAAKTAECYLWNCGLGEDNSIIASALKNNVNVFLSSSMGRLFDAVSALAGICDYNDFEGRCAIELQKYAELAEVENASKIDMKLILEKQDGVVFLNSSDIIKKSLDVNLDKRDLNNFALGFHNSIVQALLEIALIARETDGVNEIALSGGVFQNSFLLEKVLRLLRKNRFNVFFNKRVPVNDGGIALGQVYLARRL